VTIERQDVADAARLLGFACRPRAYVGREAGYAELLNRYRTDEDFGEVFDAMASGLGLRVLEVTDRALLVGAEIDSPFGFRLGEYRKADELDRRVLRGLIVLGIAAYCFPTQRSLDDTALPSVTAREVDHFLRAACEELRKRSAGAPDADVEPGLDLAWQLYLRQPEVKGTDRRRRSQSATVDLIEQTLQDFVEWGLVTEETGVGGVRRFRGLPRLRVQVREMASQQAFAALDELRREGG
jgi:hypothetical protein